MVEAINTLERFSELISRHTGLYLPDKEKVLRTLQSRIECGGFSGEDDYYYHLLSKGHEREWEKLMVQLTCGESHFFRDKGQLRLLTKRIVPELIERHKHKRSLKIWCAGCSTGEEPYTLAILISELIQRKQDWRILLLGSDINAESIAYAQEAVYRDWSFRGTGDEHIRSHFIKHRDGWKLDEGIQKMVRFCKVDLMGDPFPSASSGLFEIDLIICRNVFIYYGQDAINTMMGKFALTLADGGYLLTGHAEVANPEKSGLKLRSFPESTIFQRSTVASATVSHQPINHLSSIARAPVRERVVPIGKQPALKQQSNFSRTVPAVRPVPLSVTPQVSLAEVEKYLLSGDYSKASKLLVGYLEAHPTHIEANILQARCYANMGDLIRAQGVCKSMINKNSLSADAYYILAQLAQEQNRISEARELLQKVIYLSSEFLPAHVDLATIYQHGGEVDRAAKLWAVALRLVRALPVATKIRYMEDVSVTELQGHLETMIN